jgi:hypothetical protein
LAKGDEGGFEFVLKIHPNPPLGKEGTWDDETVIEKQVKVIPLWKWLLEKSKW